MHAKCLTYMTYRGVTQVRAGTGSATSTPAITTPVSLKSILEAAGADCRGTWCGLGWKMLITDSWLPASYISYAALTLGNAILSSSFSLLSDRELGYSREEPRRTSGRSSTSSYKDKRGFVLVGGREGRMGRKGRVKQCYQAVHVNAWLDLCLCFWNV